MNKKKLVAALASVAVVATLFAGCASKTTEGDKAPAAGDTKKIKVGLVTDQGGVNDGSFNESAVRGIEQAAKDLGIQKLNPIESKQQDAYEPNLKTMSNQADLIVGCGFMMEDAMKNVSAQVADKKFLLVDAVVENPNVSSITFKEHEGSFLAGVIAGKMTKTNKIGFVGGKEGDVIGRFEAGFVAGVMSVNEEAGKLLMSKDEKTPGQNVKYIDSFDDQGKGFEAAKLLYGSGVDIVYHAAGGAGLGVFKAAKDMDKFAIGVDSDQAVTAKDYKDVILFSMEKKVDVAVIDTIKDIQADKFAGGKLKVLGIKEGAVGIAPTVHPDVSKDAMDLCKKAEQEIKDGKIVVPGTRAELLKFKAVEIK
ncbi:BMP family lipoprotein [Clostridium algidicarnis]|uniref:BMP family lipoprotein n=1 Tax=Clostridium algidicarnis TaxID=37659 RepID=UPI001C0AB8DC|nr:BMP family ABC transporter substrate-binding protein [Clostridium algidicarnis]MBU3196489.1 BMP family ABC transporter substrate-binding protein [Clostridium algidicarnis]MBU3209630.1 BMP family ABC transporter substrate-binding protein [Clostridium algidicarnis]MBU3227116.1 BMP family ABC transporter substrate-binding protein [Clostridium algidicarnis]MBU3250641.1 BMP family ABC transporter substrate-binding protein [Clostridium algidicarnis]